MDTPRQKKTVQTIHKKHTNTPPKKNTLLEQALQFEQQRNQDLQHRLNESKTRLDRQEQQISELLQTIKDLSQGIKRLEAPRTETPPQTLPKRKKFLGIF